MIGDVTDFRKRLRLGLPARWFDDDAPILDGLLSGFASAWAGFYDLLEFTRRQSRLRTASGSFLEIGARDYLSDDFPRRANETDDEFRGRLLNALQRTRGTRSAVRAAAAAAGYSLSIFEPAQPGDTGAYNVGPSLAWNCTGAWGSLQMPLESLAVAQPESQSFEAELWSNIAHAAPAGGAVWLNIRTAA